MIICSIIRKRNKNINLNGDYLYKKDEKLLNEFIKARNINKRTMHGYKNSIKIYTAFQKNSLVNLLKEADQEEIDQVRWKDRKLKQHLINFKSYLQTKYLFSTAKIHFQRILTIYRHFDIEIHELPPFNKKSCNQSAPITFKDLPTKKIIRDAYEISNSVMKALILFMISSGCARRETLNLTIDDFIKATYEYHNTTDCLKALAILKNEKNIFPTFKIRRQKTNKYYYTFCSPEASTEIINYLLNDRKIIGSENLFKINLDDFNKNFNEINNKLNLGKVGKYNRFRSHMLRKFHASALYNSNGLSLDEIDSLQGRSKNYVHASYFYENPLILKKKYIASWNAIKIF